MSAPLADRIRPKEIDDIIGQRHLLGENCALRRIIESGSIPNMVFYGPPGIGKTTLASIIAAKTNRRLHKLNGTTASTQDIKGIVGELDTFMAQNGILLYLDEIQYFTKKQQQTLLEYIENCKNKLIASTTENPYFYVYSAILSRSTVFEFKPVPPEEIQRGIKRAFDFMRDELGEQLVIEDGVLEQIASGCGGDVRKSINSVELCVMSTVPQDGVRTITLDRARELSQRSAFRYDKDGEEHYDILSAFQKSMRGSDPDAAIHYLARLVEANDLPSICRRLMVCACEDVGLAYPQLIPIVKSCIDAAMMVGFPEARIPLADAVILVATAPKSNSAYCAINAALEDIHSGKVGSIPRRLQNKHCDGEDAAVKGQHYLYPHDYPRHYVRQQYLPDALKDAHYYEYGDNKTEQAAKAYWDSIKK
ncbi:MAG: replication-associated recombination protein A [Firmicutes bacterium]|nr:replication-associated recombination protein A [Bacillota bacterium]